MTESTDAWPPHGVSVLIGPNGSGKCRALTKANVPAFSSVANGSDVWGPLERLARDEPRGYAWILASMTEAFPPLVHHVDLDKREVQDYRGFCNPRSAALEAGFRFLAAVWDAKGYSIALRGFGDHWHPHAIRMMIYALRDHNDRLSSASAGPGARIVLVTYSPVVLNEFGVDDLDMVYVMEERQPRSLLALKDPAWLRHFALGDLYDRGEIGGP